MFADSGKRLAVLAAAFAVVAVAGCASTNEGSDSGQASSSPAPFTTPSTESWAFPPPTSPSQASVPPSLPDGVSVDRSSADSVALAAAKIWYEWDTTRDTSPYDAALRASPLMGPTCQKMMVASAPQGGAGNDWTELARVRARAQVEVGMGSEERPADSRDRASRIVTITQAFTAQKPIPVRHLAAMVVLTRTAGQWQIGSPSTHTCGLVTR